MESLSGTTNSLAAADENLRKLHNKELVVTLRGLCEEVIQLRQRAGDARFVSKGDLRQLASDMAYTAGLLVYVDRVLAALITQAQTQTSPVAVELSAPELSQLRDELSSVQAVAAAVAIPLQWGARAAQPIVWPDVWPYVPIVFVLLNGKLPRLERVAEALLAANTDAADSPRESEI